MHGYLDNGASTNLAVHLRGLNADYARCVDNDEFERWPDFFLDPCLYKVTNDYNYRLGYEAGAIYADSVGMLRDRVASLREANIYEGQKYRHLIGDPFIEAISEGSSDAIAETPFVVYRIMLDGRTELFATGRYRDKIRLDSEERLKLAERIVICDSTQIDTLLVLPL